MPGAYTMERTWRDLNFFQYKAFIHADVPRVACCPRCTCLNKGVRARSGDVFLVSGWEGNLRKRHHINHETPALAELIQSAIAAA